MKLRPWMWVVGGIPVAIFLLVVVASITDAQKERVRRAEIQGGRAHGGSAFGPKEIWAAATPGSGLMEMLRPGGQAQAVKATVGIDLQEQEMAPPESPRVAASPLKLIRTGHVSVEVPDFEKAAKELGKLVESVGGYLADTQVQRSPSGARSGSVTLRVPAASYESVGSKIRTLGKVMSERSNVQDVTKAYSDLETRLRVKRDAQNRIRELLRTKAGNLKEILEAEKEIARITEEIEQAEGERRFFDHQILLSTITVELNEPEPISLARPSSWWALSEALRDSAAMIAGSLAFMLRLVLILLPWAAAAWGLVCGIRWMRRKRKASSQNTEAPSASTGSPSEPSA